MHNNNHSFGFALAIIAAIFWGISGTFAQFLFQERSVSVEWLITARMLISGICLLLFAHFIERTSIFVIWQKKEDALNLAIFSISGMLAVQYTYFIAIKHSNAATATVLQYIGPLLIVTYLSIKSKKLPNFLEMIAIFLATIGTFLLVTHGNLHSLAISKTALIVGLLSAVALAIYTLQPIKLLLKFKSSVVVGWGMFCGGIACSFIKAPWEIEGVWDKETFIYTFLIIFFGTLVAFYLYLTSVKMIGGQKASLLSTAEPLSAILFAVFWLNITFLPIDWVGAICIISTIFILSKSGKKLR